MRQVRILSLVSLKDAKFILCSKLNSCLNHSSSFLTPSVKCFTNEDYELKRFTDGIKQYQKYSVNVQKSLSLLNVIQQVSYHNPSGVQRIK